MSGFAPARRLVTDFTHGGACKKKKKKRSHAQKINSDTCSRIQTAQRNNIMQRVGRNKVADGRYADGYSQCAGGRGSVLPLAKEQ